jgi:hypothetical protein
LREETKKKWRQSKEAQSGFDEMDFLRLFEAFGHLQPCLDAQVLSAFSSKREFTYKQAFIRVPSAQMPSHL